jgi:hypothetical protein
MARRMGTSIGVIPLIIKQQSNLPFKISYAMSNRSFFRLCCTGTLVFVLATAFGLPTPAGSSVFQMVSLASGTSVTLSLNENIAPENASIGNSVDFLVRANVTVNGKVLIATGATGSGTIRKIKKACRGECAEVTITVESAMAVDGQMVRLRSIPVVVKIQGSKNAEGGLGANVRAFVLNDIRINA